MRSDPLTRNPSPSSSQFHRIKHRGHSKISPLEFSSSLLLVRLGFEARAIRDFGDRGVLIDLGGKAKAVLEAQAL